MLSFCLNLLLDYYYWSAKILLNGIRKKSLGGYVYENKIKKGITEYNMVGTIMTVLLLKVKILQFCKD